jgi:hypothetical protein
MLSAYLPHGIHRGLAQLMGQVVALDEADSVLTLQKEKAIAVSSKPKI